MKRKILSMQESIKDARITGDVLRKVFGYIREDRWNRNEMEVAVFREQVWPGLREEYDGKWQSSYDNIARILPDMNAVIFPLHDAYNFYSTRRGLAVGMSVILMGAIPEILGVTADNFNLILAGLINVFHGNCDLKNADQMAVEIKQMLNTIRLQGKLPVEFFIKDDLAQLYANRTAAEIANQTSAVGSE